MKLIMALLSRDDFRTNVFKRDKYTCVVPGCKQKAQDAHHIIERRLWTDQSEHGGYFLSNGASVCGYHHEHAAETCTFIFYSLRKSNIIRPVFSATCAHSSRVDKTVRWTYFGDHFSVIAFDCLKETRRRRFRNCLNVWSFCQGRKSNRGLHYTICSHYAKKKYLKTNGRSPSSVEPQIKSPI